MNSDLIVEKPEQSYLKAHRGFHDGYWHTISLEFRKNGGKWRVYQYGDGAGRKWHITTDKEWKTEKEAEAFLKEKGWDPL